MYRITLDSNIPEDIPEGAPSLRELIMDPPNHWFLPPLPSPSPPLLCRDKLSKVIDCKPGVLISMDTIYPYTCCVSL